MGYTLSKLEIAFYMARSGSYRITAALTAGFVLAACTTQVQRIGYDDGRDACRALVVQLDSTGNFFGEDIVQGAAIGAVSGALISGLATGTWQGALTGALIGAPTGAAIGYYSALQRQQRDQAGVNAQIANDLQRENTELNRTQIAFDQLFDCRLRSAQHIRQAVRDGRLNREVATQQLAEIRQRANGDIALAQTINGRISTRGAEIDGAIDAVVPGGKVGLATAGTPQPTRVTPRRSVDVVFSPQPDSPKIAEIRPREAVAVRPGPPGFVQVETANGVRGYAASAAFPAPRASVQQPAEGSDVRSLAATNLSRRETFTASVSNAERLTQSGGFELTS